MMSGYAEAILWDGRKMQCIYRINGRMRIEVEPIGDYSVDDIHFINIDKGDDIITLELPKPRRMCIGRPAKEDG
jgi:hypothetical protein